MWHYEYTIDHLAVRLSADTLDACLTGLLKARVLSVLLTRVKIFEGGTSEFGSGIRYHASLDPS